MNCTSWPWIRPCTSSMSAVTLAMILPTWVELWYARLSRWRCRHVANRRSNTNRCPIQVTVVAFTNEPTFRKATTPTSAPAIHKSCVAASWVRAIAAASCSRAARTAGVIALSIAAW